MEPLPKTPWPPFDRAAHPRVDLHSHTTLSDGSLTPRELVRLAAGVGLEVLAVTDHDTTEALAEALDEGQRVGLRIIPGMEVSALLPPAPGVDAEGRGAPRGPAGTSPLSPEAGGAGARSGAPTRGEGVGRNVHILAYFPARSMPRVATWQAERRELRRARLLRMVERLAALGAPIELEAITRGADPRRSPGRLHVARALVAAGHVGDVREAFDRFLAAGQPGYVQDQVPAATEALAMIRGLGGLSVVAHPALDLQPGDLADLAARGLDGVEAFHHCHGPDQAAEWAARASALGLVVTGGSDYHGDPRAEGAPPPAAEGEQRLGHVPLPHAAWEAFEAALAARAGPGCDVSRPSAPVGDDEGSRR